MTKPFVRALGVISPSPFSEMIYTTSAMSEPMEVYPDGTVVILYHRKVVTFADGHQEVRYARITAKPC